MSESEKMDLILSGLQEMKSNMQEMKSDMRDMKSDMRNMKSDMNNMKSDIQDLRDRMTGLELHIENGTDKNIQLLAENFVELTKKLNQAIPVADKNLAYEVKVNYLLEEFEKLKLTVDQLKTQLAS